MAVEYNAADQQRVNQIKSELIKALAPFKHNTEALLVAIAAGQVLRVFLEKYPSNVRREMVDQVFIPFLKNEGDSEGKLIESPFELFTNPFKRKN